MQAFGDVEVRLKIHFMVAGQPNDPTNESGGKGRDVDCWLHELHTGTLKGRHSLCCQYRCWMGSSACSQGHLHICEWQKVTVAGVSEKSMEACTTSSR